VFGLWFGHLEEWSVTCIIVVTGLVELVVGFVVGGSCVLVVLGLLRDKIQ
jgi:hypothetical protein